MTVETHDEDPDELRCTRCGEPLARGHSCRGRPNPESVDERGRRARGGRRHSGYDRVLRPSD